jgi:uncharacterized membrane protein
MPRGSARPDSSTAGRAPGRGATAGPWWVWPVAALAAAAGAVISGYLAVTALQGAPPVCLAGDCAAVAASPYARLLGLPTAAWGFGLYVVAGTLALACWRGRQGAWAPAALLGVAVFGSTFSLYLLWIQVGVLRAVCSWCVASDVLWVVVLGLALTGALAAE